MKKPKKKAATDLPPLPKGQRYVSRAEASKLVNDTLRDFAALQRRKLKGIQHVQAWLLWGRIVQAAFGVHFRLSLNLSGDIFRKLEKQDNDKQTADGAVEEESSCGTSGD